MKSKKSGITVSFNGSGAFPVLMTPSSETGFVYCKKCRGFAESDRLLQPGPCRHNWVPGTQGEPR